MCLRIKYTFFSEANGQTNSYSGSQPKSRTRIASWARRLNVKPTWISAILIVVVSMLAFLYFLSIFCNFSSLALKDMVSKVTKAYICVFLSDDDLLDNDWLSDCRHTQIWLCSWWKVVLFARKFFGGHFIFIMMTSKLSGLTRDTFDWAGNLGTA